MLFAPNISAIFNRRLGRETRLGLEKLCLEFEKMGLRSRAPPFPDLQLPLSALNDTLTTGKAWDWEKEDLPLQHCMEMLVIYLYIKISACSPNLPAQG